MVAKPDAWMSNAQIVSILQQLGAREPNDVVALVQSPNDTIAVNACWLLGQFGNKRYSSVLLTALSGNREALWMPSAISLSLLDSKRTVRRSICLLLAPQRPARQRYAAGYALAFTPCALNDPRVRSAFLLAVRDQQAPPSVRGVVAEGLGNMFSGCFTGQEHQRPAYDETGQVLMSMFHDPSPEVRFWAAFAIGSMRYLPARSALHLLAKTDTAAFGGWWTVGEEASDAIDRIEGREPPERVVLTKEQALQQGRTI